LTEIKRSETRNLVFYFIAAYGFTWLFWILEAQAMKGQLGTSIIVDFLLGSRNPAAWGPTIAAFCLTYLNEGTQGIKTLLKRATNTNFPKIWWLPTFLLLPALTGGALLLSIITEGTTTEIALLANPIALLIGWDSFISIFLFRGPLQEEFGWRGYALPRLQSRFNALISSIILGVIWFAWHIPYYTLVGDEAIFQSQFIGLSISHILLTILITWLFNNTDGSILVSLIFHTTISFSWVLFPFVETQSGSMYYFFLLLIAVTLILVIWKPKRFVREKR
jgi:membrane protease YdiL (CAAX protease family)